MYIYTYIIILFLKVHWKIKIRNMCEYVLFCLIEKTIFINITDNITNTIKELFRFKIVNKIIGSWRFSLHDDFYFFFILNTYLSKAQIKLYPKYVCITYRVHCQLLKVYTRRAQESTRETTCFTCSMWILSWTRSSNGRILRSRSRCATLSKALKFLYLALSSILARLSCSIVYMYTYILGWSKKFIRHFPTCFLIWKEYKTRGKKTNFLIMLIFPSIYVIQYKSFCVTYVFPLFLKNFIF